MFARLRHRGVVGLAVALAIGVALRLLYPQDIEWKEDEQWTFAHATAMASGGGWEAVGMGSSFGPPNPGLSLWVFGLLVKTFAINSPPALASTVQSMNALALIGFAVFIRFAIAPEGREFWRWSLALWALNPLAIVFERKIWPPSVLPLFFVAFLACWHARKHPLAAFGWGLLGALMSQVHLGVFLLVIAVLVWTCLDGRRPFSLAAWLAGSVIGALPAVPWFIAVSHGTDAHVQLRAPILTFFSRWLMQPFGLNIEYTLGWGEMLRFLHGPNIAGYPSYLMAIAHLLIVGVLVVTVLMALRRAMTEAPSWRGALIGTSEATNLITASLWGYGGPLTLLTMLGAGSHRHYMIVILPVMALWCALFVFYGQGLAGTARARRMLTMLCAAQAFASIGLIDHIHRVQVIPAEYGSTWQSQQAQAPAR